MHEAMLRSRLWPVDGVGWKRLGPSRQQCKAGVSCGPHHCGRICVRVEFLGSLLSLKTGIQQPGSSQAWFWG